MPRSGGPRTLEGKQKSALNAIKHGAYVTKPILPGENKAEYEALYQDCFEVFKPIGVLEESLAIQLINAMWAKARYANIEYLSLQQAIKKPDAAIRFGLSDFPYMEDSRAKKFMHQLDQLSDDDFSDLVKIYQVADTTYPRKDLGLNDVLSIQKECPNLYKYILTLARQVFLGEIQAKQLLEMTTYEEYELTYLELYLFQVLQELRDIDWFYEHLELIRQEVKIFQSQRVMGFMQTLSHHRVKRDLDATYSRAYKELMRVKQWKEDHGTIDLPNVLDVEKRLN